MSKRKSANIITSGSKVTSYTEKMQILDVTLKLDSPIPDFMEYFDDNSDDPVAHTEYFNQVIVPWEYFMSHKLYAHAELLWDRFINYAYGWENYSNKKVHKGAPFYYAAVTSILAMHVERGFLLMNKALEEDQATYGTSVPVESPAYSFLTLDPDKQDQHFRDKVTEIADYVEKNVDSYRNSRNGELTYTDFKKKFLEPDSVQELIFVFMYEMFRIKSTSQEVDQRIKQNAISSLLLTDSMCNISLILDNLIRHKNSGESGFDSQLEFLVEKSDLSLNKNTLETVHQSFENDFSGSLSSLLNSSFTNGGGDKLTPIEEDLAIAYGFRTFGANKIEPQPVIYDNFDEFTSRVLNTLFFTVEKLY